MRFIRIIPGLLVAAAVVGCASNTGKTWTYAPAPSAVAGGASASAAPASPGATATSGPSSAALTAPAAGGTAEILEVHAFDMGFKPAELSVPAAGDYVVKLVNDGSIPHDITFPDGTVIVAAAKKTAEAKVTVPADGLAFICSVPGHKDAGMTGRMAVSGGTAAGPSASPGGSPAPSASPGGDDHGGPAPTTDVPADPNAPAPVTFDATAPAVLDGTLHDIDLVIEEKLMTVAPGFQQKVWTFGGTVPGPVIRVKVGDTVRVHLINPTTSQVSHSIDFHASQVAWNDEMRSIAPGEELVYEWKAEYAGVWMYHCGTPPALHHIANGMFGMVIVEPAGGLPKVDREFTLVQSEWYLGPQGDLTSPSKASVAAPAPEFVVFNGVADQYVEKPLQVPTGGRVRMFVLDAGPSIDSSFHIVGTIFDTVIKEGIALRKGNDGSWGSQAVDLSPAQGAIVEFTTAEDGLYPVVTHAFNFVGRGALGLIQAGDGDPSN